MGEIFISCGGDSEVIIGCLGNEQVGGFFQFVKEKVGELAQFGIIPTGKFSIFNAYWIWILLIFVLFGILWYIYKKSRG